MNRHSMSNGNLLFFLCRKSRRVPPTGRLWGDEKETAGKQPSKKKAAQIGQSEGKVLKGRYGRKAVSFLKFRRVEK